MANFSGLVGKVFLATQASRGSVAPGSAAGTYLFTEANSLANQSAIVGTYGADATITFLSTTPPNASNNFYTFSARLLSTNIFANNQIISGTFLGNDATDFLLNADGVPGVGAAFLFFTNTAAQQPGPGNTATVSDVLNNVAYTAPACFATGTLIDTTRGPVAVECLAIGDLVLIHDAAARGVAATRPVVWIGHRALDCRRHPCPAAVWPVRVRAGAFGEGLPRRDLLLSPDHAVHAEGVLIPVKHLINGGSVVQEAVDSVVYHHIALSAHDVVLAEGLPAESYLDTGDRANFDNAEGPVRLFPAFSPSLAWEAHGCAPLMVTGPEVEAVRTLLARRATAQEDAPRARAG